ncbi:hypothetical protein FA95DRAFT_1561258 [Auriscalpium vulgare]|uniref:Uncharacterized protein n=1 Tax=Auriscalpium vulgare TaxID=40419 RepID=A0ACB8RNN3_9AGAM|nr:hypothetical protein FA95DRAFT_1561258 [Auriscalpium vulgare]
MGDKDTHAGPSPFVHRAPSADIHPSPHYSRAPSHYPSFTAPRNAAIPPLAPLDYLQSQRRGSITDPSLHAAAHSRLPRSAVYTAASPDPSFDPPSASREPSSKPAFFGSRPMSPYKFGDASSHSPGHSYTQSPSRRGSLESTAGSSSLPPHHQQGSEGRPHSRASKLRSSQALAHVSGDRDHSESKWPRLQSRQVTSNTYLGEGRPSSMIGQTSQAPRGAESPSLPHGTKRKLSHERGVPTAGGDEIDPQLIGPGVPSSAGVDMEGPSPKRRGSMAGLAQSIFDRRHSLDARVSSAGPQWWPSDRRDSTSSMFSSPSMSYGSPAFSADSSHSHVPGATPAFAMPAMQPADQAQAMQSEGETFDPRGFDPTAVSHIAMTSTMGFSADRRMSVPTNLPSTMPPQPTTSRVLRSRSRPPSRAAGRARGSEQPTGDPSGSQSGGATDSGGPEAGSPQGHSKDSGATPYSRSPELRVSHKLAERKRRKEMKDLFDELRDQLPADRGMKASKWEILSKAVDFIVQLKTGQQDMGREIEMLRHELESVRHGMPPFGTGAPHPGMYPPVLPGHFPPTGPSMPAPLVPPSQTGAPHPPPPPSRPGSSTPAGEPPQPPQNISGSSDSAGGVETS